jgi:hypothetical protein
MPSRGGVLSQALLDAGAANAANCRSSALDALLRQPSGDQNCLVLELHCVLLKAALRFGSQGQTRRVSETGRADRDQFRGPPASVPEEILFDGR